MTRDEALALVSEKMHAAGSGMVTLAGGRLSNEDLFNIHQLNPGSDFLLYSYMGGGDLIPMAGVAKGTNFGEMGKGNVILVIASDLHEEAPLWWLRIKGAVKRGATLIVVSPRPTRLEKYAAHVVRYAYGEEVQTAAAFLSENVGGASENTPLTPRATDTPTPPP